MNEQLCPGGCGKDISRALRLYGPERDRCQACARRANATIGEGSVEKKEKTKNEESGVNEDKNCVDCGKVLKYRYGHNKNQCSPCSKKGGPDTIVAARGGPVAPSSAPAPTLFEKKTLTEEPASDLGAVMETVNKLIEHTDGEISPLVIDNLSLAVLNQSITARLRAEAALGILPDSLDATGTALAVGQ